MSSPNRLTAYRSPSENWILLATLLLIVAIIAFTAAATLCGSVVFVGAILLIAYSASQSHHRELLRSAFQVTPNSSPELARILQECADRLRVEPVQVFIYPSQAVNAYTFGLSSPKAIVLYKSLLQVMDPIELKFVIGHEMGHICLGHTWLNSLVGGMAGIPASAPAAVLLVFALRWWNRACEYSADRAGLLACSRLDRAISALVKLEAARYNRGSLTPEDIQKAIQRIESEDDDWINLAAELLTTHPMIVKRINQIRQFAHSARYKQIRAMIQ